LQALLTERAIEALVAMNGQRSGVAFSLVDVRLELSGDLEHRCADVDADDLAVAAQALLRKSRDDARAARHVDDAHLGREIGASKQRFRPGPKEWLDERALIHPRKA
jgi:hypothetical protein